MLLLAPDGIGMMLNVVNNDELQVVEFSYINDYECSPAEQSGLINIGDFLIGVNGIYVAI
jgi:hypothetical protein